MPFVIRTIILYTIGIEYVGLGGLFGSLISILNITELGFGGAISYILYRPVAEGKDEEVCAILNFSRKCFAVIGMAVLTIGLMMLPFLDHFVHGEYPDGLNIDILYLFYLGNSVVSYVMYSYKRILFAAVQRYDIETRISSAAISIQYILQVFLLIAFKNYYFYVLMIPVATILNNLLCAIVTKKMYPHYSACGSITKADKDIIKKKVKGVFFSKLGSTVFLSADNLVISSFFGLTMLGRYSNYYMIITMLLSVFAIIHNTFRPIIGNCIITDTIQSNYCLLKKIYITYYWAASVCSCCMLCLYQDFIMVWAGKQNMLPFNMVILFILYWSIDRIISIPVVFVEAAGFWWEVRYVTLAETALNLILNIILSQIIGISGVLLSTIISIALISIYGYFKVLFTKYFNLEQLRDFLKYIFDIFIRSSSALIITWIIIKNVKADSLEKLIIKGCLTLIVFFVCGFVLNIKNKNANILRNYICQLLRRKNK